MKELSIEEKAKAYDEAIKKAGVLYKSSEPLSGCNVIIETLFPELKESEDERIRKELITYCQVNMGHTWHNIKQEDYIAWLEKQGEQKPAEDVNLLEFKSYLCLMLQKFRTKGICTNDEIIDYVRENSQKLRDILVKSAWSEEDERHLNSIIKRTIAYGDSSIHGLIKDDIDWIKGIKDRVQPQQKQEWSDEHYELEEFAKIVRGNLTGISKAVQELFEAKYLQLTGNKMYRGYKD